jgi:hypothetical protein
MRINELEIENLWCDKIAKAELARKTMIETAVFMCNLRLSGIVRMQAMLF